MTGTLAQRTISGMLWNSMQRFGTLSISFLVNLVLARLLSPEDFGCIGMLMVFIAVANAFIDGGFGAALIQKKFPTQEDYSTVFYWNLVLSAVLFITLFFAAPAIARFYKIPLLCDVLRVQSSILILNAFYLVPSNILRKKLEFKSLAKVSIVSSLLSAVIGITLALCGFGVWSLVANMFFLSLFQALFFWFWYEWRPLFFFSWKSFKELFSFGSLMLLSSVVETIYGNVSSLIIGRVYSARDLGFYTQAKKVEMVPTNSLANIVNSVTFPVFSQVQDDREQLRYYVQKNVKSITFITFPLMALLIVVAQPLFTFLFTDKWDSAVPYFQILCVVGMVDTLNSTNTNVFKSLGKSGIFFTVQLIKRSLGIVSILIGLQYGISGLLWGITISGYLNFFINAFVTGRLINYGIKEQMRDVGLSYLLALIAGCVTFFLFSFVEWHYFISLVAQAIVYAVVYLGGASVMKLEGYSIYRKILIDRMKKVI